MPVRAPDSICSINCRLKATSNRRLCFPMAETPESKSPRRRLWKLPHLWKSNKEGYALSLDDFHKVLGKQKTLSTVTTASATVNQSFSTPEKPLAHLNFWEKSPVEGAQFNAHPFNSFTPSTPAHREST